MRVLRHERFPSKPIFKKFGTMFDPANQSETFKRFLEVFFGECTYMIIHDGIDVSPLYHLSVQEQSLAEDLMIEHLEKGKLDFRLVIGLGKLRSQRAIPLLINFLQRTDSGLSRIHTEGCRCAHSNVGQGETPADM